MPETIPNSLCKVRPREILVLPNAVHVTRRLWAKEGEIVDARVPAVRKFLVGQEYKLEAVEAGEPAPLPPVVAAAVAREMAEQRPVAAADVAEVAAARQDGHLKIPAPDQQRPKKSG